MREAFDGAVVQVPRGDDKSGVRRDRRFVDLELVVLARDRDTARSEILHGMVRAVVAERQPRRCRADRATDELMAEADPEDRQCPVHPP